MLLAQPYEKYVSKRDDQRKAASCDINSLRLRGVTRSCSIVLFLSLDYGNRGQQCDNIIKDNQIRPRMMIIAPGSDYTSTAFDCPPGM